MQRRSPFIPQLDDDAASEDHSWTGMGTGFMSVPQSPAVDFGTMGRRRSSAVKVDLGEISRRGMRQPPSGSRRGSPAPRRRHWARWLLGVMILCGFGYLLVERSSASLSTLPLRSRTSVCPNPLLPRPFFPSAQLSTSVSLPSISALFALSLRYSPAHCNTFRLSFSRRDRGVCRRATADIRAVRRRAGGTDEEWEEDDRDDLRVKQRFGPDGFLVQIEGAERREEEVPSVFDSSLCEWHFDFALVNAGVLWMNVTHMYEDYEAIVDIVAPPQSRPKPKMLMRPLIAAPLRLDLCAGCSPFVVPSIENAEVEEKVYGLPQPQQKTSKCSANSSALQGAYLPSSHFSLLFPPQPLPLSEEHSRPTAGMHSFIRPACLADSPHLSHDGLRFRDHSSCLRPAEDGGVRHRALIIGDSHGRAIYDGADWRILKGEKGVALSSPKALSKKDELGGWGLEFAWDPYLTSGFSCEYLRQFDSITVSAGTHSAAWDCPSTAIHLTHLSSVLSTWPTLLKECHATPSPDSSPSARTSLPTLILLTIPAFHPQLHNRDCRTGARIALWNEGGRAIARREGWKVVDYEGYTKAMAGDSASVGDGVHFLKTDAMDPLVDDWIGQLGVCGDEDRSARGAGRSR